MPQYNALNGSRSDGSRVGTVVLEEVSRTYPGSATPALQATSLTIEPGEFFSILGSSGSGKTTTLRLIAGFERPNTGVVRLSGEDVTALPPNKRDVNTVFQNYALFPHLTVAENIAYPLEMKKLPKAERATRVAQALELVEMKEYGGRLPHQLSGGQRQRIALARALVGQPKVLLLDEPLGALDLRLRQQMQHVLTALQKRLGITFVYVTHDQGEALSMSDRVAVMNKGRIEQIGSPQDLYFAPRNEFVARFVGKSNLLETDVKASGNAFSGSIAGVAFDLPRATRAGKAKLVLRGESVGIDREQGTSASIPAQVKDVLFLGTSLEVSLDCAGHELIAIVPVQRSRTYEAGDPVFCRFQAQDVGVLYD